MRLLPISVYVGVMRCTENNENPLFVVQESPFSAPSFDDYRWFRTTIKVRVQDAITEVGSGDLEEIDQPDLRSEGESK